MKYYQLKLCSRNENIKDELSEGPKIYPKANGSKISNSNGYLSKGGGNSGRYFLKIMLMMHPYLITFFYTVYLTKKNMTGFY